MQDDHLKQFTVTVILLARVLGDVKDRVILRRMHADMISWIQAYIRLPRESYHVAQSESFYGLKSSYGNLTRDLEDLEHFHLCPPTPLAQTQRALCQWYKLILEQAGASHRRKEEKAPVQERGVVASLEKQGSTKEQPLSLSDNQQKILSFIRSSPDARTKDIIDEFSSLSDRTIKRNLRELADAGLITRRAGLRAAFYSIRSRES
jgi:DNA-binding MarR family transcriptional regulator